MSLPPDAPPAAPPPVEEAPARRNPFPTWLLVVTIALFVLAPFLFWHGTWFGAR